MSVADFLTQSVPNAAAAREVQLLVRTALASEPSDLSLLYFLHYVKASGGLAQLGDGTGGAQTFRIGGGAQQVSERIAAEIRASGVDILLGAPVEEIMYDQSCRGNHGAGPSRSGPADGADRSCGVAGAGCGAPAASCGSQSCRCTCGSCGGATLHSRGCAPLRARCVVVALAPPLWLRISFRPPLPHPKQAVARGMFYGQAIKTIAVFETAFWERSDRMQEGAQGRQRPQGHTPPGNGDGGSGCSSSSTGHGHTADGDAPGLAITGVPGRAAASPNAGGGPLRPAPDLDLDLDQIGPVSNLFPSRVGSKPALVGLIVATAARRFRGLGQAAQRAAVLEQYAAWFRSGAALSPVAFYCMDWGLEEHSAGCYAAMMPPGLATQHGDSVLEPVGCVHWAGSELAAEWPGYLEGAVESGQQAAAEVLLALCGRGGGGGAYAAPADAVRHSGGVVGSGAGGVLAAVGRSRL